MFIGKLLLGVLQMAYLKCTIFQVAYRYDLTVYLQNYVTNRPPVCRCIINKPFVNCPNNN